MKKVFTTGQVAKICQVAPRTVSKWFDSGRLRGYRIPGSQDRRIPREALIRFLKENGMPMGNLEEESWHKMLVIGAKLFIDRLNELLPDEDYKYGVANSGFEAGMQAEFRSRHHHRPGSGRSRQLQIAQNLRRKDESQQTLPGAASGRGQPSRSSTTASARRSRSLSTSLYCRAYRTRVEERRDA
jgi:excisionase family DNA binding protein